ncbi:MAG: ABC transporter permease [Termitinemataceae bacterium]|nr:MAG: ABC transporter permease [Termitinemataceae bacterium]
MPKTIKQLQSFSLMAVLLVAWFAVTSMGLVPQYMLPSPQSVAKVFVDDFFLLAINLKVTLFEAMCGMIFALVCAFVIAVIMDANQFLKASISPIITLSQTMPVIALAPLLVLWLGYGILPKIALVFVTCFFPICAVLVGSFAAADIDIEKLFVSMGSTRFQIYRYYKLPAALGDFFSSLKVSVTYSLISAVVAEWLGGNAGLGVYMIRVRKTYSFDKMFAAIVLIAAVSLLLIRLVNVIERYVMPYIHFAAQTPTAALPKTKGNLKPKNNIYGTSKY